MEGISFDQSVNFSNMKIYIQISYYLICFFLLYLETDPGFKNDIVEKSMRIALDDDVI